MMTLDPTAYAERRETIRTYFDRTALDAWKQFATDTPLGRIRETVRQGRESMRAALIGRLPADLSGWRILDAGCGAGHLSVALANRGADVVGVDLAPEMIAHAEEHLPEITGSGSVHLIAGDMLTAADGRFDAIVAMDSVIHYAPEMAARAVAHLVSKADRQVVFSVAPSTPALLVKRASAKLFPKPDRAPLIEPVRPSWLTRRLDDHTGADGWQAAIGPRISTGFYTSQVMEVRRHG